MEAKFQKKHEKFLCLARTVTELKGDLRNADAKHADDLANRNQKIQSLQQDLQEKEEFCDELQQQLQQERKESAALRDQIGEIQDTYAEEQELQQISLLEEAERQKADDARNLAEMKAAHAKAIAEERQKCQEEVMRDFFFMLVMSIKVKMQREILAGEAMDRSAQDLFVSMQQNSVPFHSWHAWVHDQLTITTKKQ